METEQQLQEEQGEKKAGWGKKRIIALAVAIGAVVVAAVLLLALLPGGNGAAIGEPRSAVFRGKDDSLYLLGVDRKFQPLNIKTKERMLSRDEKTLFYIDETGTLGSIDTKTLEKRTLATGAEELGYVRLNNGVVYRAADSAANGKDSDEAVLRALARYLNENNEEYKGSGEELLYQIVQKSYADVSAQGLVKDAKEYYKVLVGEEYHTREYNYISLDGQTSYTIAINSGYSSDIRNCATSDTEDIYAYIAPDGGVMLCRGSGAPEKVASVGDPKAAKIKSVSAGGRMLVWVEEAANGAYMVRYLDSRGVNAIETQMDKESSYIMDCSNGDGSRLFLFCETGEIITITDGEGYSTEKVPGKIESFEVLRPDNKNIYVDTLETLQSVTFIARDGEDSRLYVIESDGKPEQLDFGYVTGVIRDGDTIWYCDKNSSLFTASLKGGAGSARLLADRVRSGRCALSGDGQTIYYYGEQEQTLYSIPAKGGVSRVLEENNSSELNPFAVGEGAVYLNNTREAWEDAYTEVGDLMLCRGDGAPQRIAENVLSISDYRSYSSQRRGSYIAENDFYFYGDAKIDAQNETIEYTLYHYDGKEATAVMEGLRYL